MTANVAQGDTSDIELNLSDLDIEEAGGGGGDHGGDEGGLSPEKGNGDEIVNTKRFTSNKKKNRDDADEDDDEFNFDFGKVRKKEGPSDSSSGAGHIIASTTVFTTSSSASRAADAAEAVATRPPPTEKDTTKTVNENKRNEVDDAVDDKHKTAGKDEEIRKQDDHNGNGRGDSTVTTGRQRSEDGGGRKEAEKVSNEEETYHTGKGKEVGTKIEAAREHAVPTQTISSAFEKRPGSSAEQGASPFNARDGIDRRNNTADEDKGTKEKEEEEKKKTPFSPPEDKKKDLSQKSTATARGVEEERNETVGGETNALKALRQQYNAVVTTTATTTTTETSEDDDTSGDEWNQATKSRLRERRAEEKANEKEAAATAQEHSAPLPTLEWRQAYDAIRFASLPASTSSAPSSSDVGKSENGSIEGQAPSLSSSATAAGGAAGSSIATRNKPTVLRPSGSGMPIFVKIQDATTGGTGKPFTINVEATDSIETVKAMIQEMQGIPAKRLRLTFSGTKLEDGNDRKTVGDFKIEKESTLHCQLVLPSDESLAVSATTAGSLSASAVPAAMKQQQQSAAAAVPATKNQWRQYLTQLQRGDKSMSHGGKKSSSSSSSGSKSGGGGIGASFWNMCWGLWHTDITPGTPLHNEQDFIMCLMKVPLDHSDPLHRRILLTIYSRSVNAFGYCPSSSSGPVAAVGSTAAGASSTAVRQSSLVPNAAHAIIPGVQTTGASRWERLGFQGNDPGTDLRFSGLFGLLTFLHVVDTSEHHFGRHHNRMVGADTTTGSSNDGVVQSVDEDAIERIGPKKIHPSFTKKMYDVGLSRLLHFPIAIVIFNFVGIALESLLRRELHDYIHQQHQEDLHRHKARILRQQTAVRRATTAGSMGGKAIVSSPSSSSASAKTAALAAEQLPTTAVSTVVILVTLGMLHYFLEAWCEEPTRSIIDFDRIKKQTAKHCLSHLKETIERGKSCHEKQKTTAQQQQLAAFQTSEKNKKKKKQTGSEGGSGTKQKAGRGDNSIAAFSAF